MAYTNKARAVNVLMYENQIRLFNLRGEIDE